MKKLEIIIQPEKLEALKAIREKELPSLFSGNHTNVYISVTNRERFGVMLDDILITTLERRYYQK